MSITFCYSSMYFSQLYTKTQFYKLLVGTSINIISEIILTLYFTCLMYKSSKIRISALANKYYLMAKLDMLRI